MTNKTMIMIFPGLLFALLLNACRGGGTARALGAAGGESSRCGSAAVLAPSPLRSCPVLNPSPEPSPPLRRHGLTGFPEAPAQR